MWILVFPCIIIMGQMTHLILRCTLMSENNGVIRLFALLWLGIKAFSFVPCFDMIYNGGISDNPWSKLMWNNDVFLVPCSYIIGTN